MVEILAVALTGATLAAHATSFLDAAGKPPDAGQLLLAIDPNGLAGGAVFADRLEDLADMIEADPGARLPGSRRLALREAARRQGVTLDVSLLA